ncbi:MAG: hypothetical protein K8T20_03415 [Planctomycetes bacterium]|nr:hypothetical protein [Planctomycetota bacterium]
MRTLALIVFALHFAAVLATSGTALCVTAGGEAGYEWSEDGCCGEDVEAGCERGLTMSHPPDCGGCADGLAPLPGGLHLHVNVPIPALVEAGTVEPETRMAAGEIVIAARESAEAIAPVSLPLRC